MWISKRKQPIIVADSHQQVDQTPTDTTLNDSLNLVVGSIREVRDRPTSVDQDLVVERVDQFRENTESRSDLLSVSFLLFFLQSTDRRTIGHSG